MLWGIPGPGQCLANPVQALRQCFNLVVKSRTQVPMARGPPVRLIGQILASFTRGKADGDVRLLQPSLLGILLDLFDAVTRHDVNYSSRS